VQRHLFRSLGLKDVICFSFGAFVPVLPQKRQRAPMAYVNITNLWSHWSWSKPVFDPLRFRPINLLLPAVLSTRYPTDEAPSFFHANSATFSTEALLYSW